MVREKDFVSIITVNYNGMAFLEDYFKSLNSLDYPSFETIIVDNGSNDGSLQFIQKNYKKARVFKNKSNNFCSANNIGVMNAKGKYVVLLNNDTKVDKNWLKELVKTISQKKCAAVQSKVLLMDGKINSAGIIELPNFYIDNLGYLEEDKGQYDYDNELTAVYNASAIYDREKLISAGLFDEDFEHYVDEIDIAFRLKKMGEKLFFSHKSIVYHKYQGTFAGMPDRFKRFTERNRLYFVAKYFPEKLLDAIFSSHIFYKDIKINHPFLFSLMPEVLEKYRKHNGDENTILLSIGLARRLGEVIRLDNLDYQKEITSIHQKFTEADRENLVFQKENETLAQEKKSLEHKNNSMEKEIRTLRQEKEYLITHYNQTKDTLEKEIHTLKQEKEYIISETNHTRDSLENEIHRLKDIEIKMQHDMSHMEQERIKDVSDLKKIIYGFYNSRGYKLLLKPIDVVYKKLFR